MTKRILILTLLIAATTPAFAQEVERPKTDAPDQAPQIEKPAVPDQSLEERVAFLLSGYEYFPTRADLDGLAKADVMVPLLLSFARDDTRRNTQRLRALDALGYYDDEPATAYLRATATTKGEHLKGKKARIGLLMRHHAITSLAKSKKEAAVTDLAPLLKDSDVQIRLTVINALGKHGGEAGKIRLNELANAENDRVVRRELSKWVQR